MVPGSHAEHRSTTLSVHWQFTRLLSVWTQKGIPTSYWPYSDCLAKVTKHDLIATGFCWNGMFLAILTRNVHIWPYLAIIGQTLRKWISRLGVWVYKSLRNVSKSGISLRLVVKVMPICHRAALFWEKTWKSMKMRHSAAPGENDAARKCHFLTVYNGSQYFPRRIMHLSSKRRFLNSLLDVSKTWHLRLNPVIITVNKTL